ncbi:YfcZ/YiiS family protein [Aggregatibacter actinomycetemcomitans]|uniref:YfcZ/YiiS family protein n=1 Tax=Aggregatibacter actinomycetemcomitans TaxID=714 RepID=UPI000301903D|nr:YfcZ/YiiS family protein [Aggregatibacter actinomycetemcomitans]AHN72477.1 hypothetical protein CF65_02333 [Aggregatibacter actinomycetemcomitans HK1651]KND84767.1 hypothetical protein SCC1398_0200490 [Aggregatibacter actinomycetemcomitans serotype b str. SCC1398]KOE56165.1 hypothetical protein SCC4092_0201310 [Aggregatibacter actinomycetemcomitans serotype b str. SCC4092]QPQ81263.1 YfcZ/YiiS family protein [Aggregatibacter actinomycetemcomitans]
MSTLKCQAEEAKVCCCVEVGTVIDGSDCTVDFEQVYATEEAAKEALSCLTEKAKAAESDPCKISSEISVVENGFKLTAKFEFSCQAESMIFQLSTR